MMINGKSGEENKRKTGTFIYFFLFPCSSILERKMKERQKEDREKHNRCEGLIDQLIMNGSLSTLNKVGVSQLVTIILMVENFFK